MLTPAAPVISIYSKDPTMEVTINSTRGDGIFIYQQEVVTLKGDHPSNTMYVVYTPEGLYIGTTEIAEMLIRKGITRVECASKDNTVCSIGFNPTEQTWYGWSHRSIYGFSIGSEVKKGDCAYNPATKEDQEQAFCEFWAIGVEKECEIPERKCTTVLDYLTHDVTKDGTLGFDYSMSTVFNFEGRGPFKSSGFQPYPNTWGRGEWRALTIEDAKQMAIDFADGVS